MEHHGISVNEEPSHATVKDTTKTSTQSTISSTRKNSPDLWQTYHHPHGYTIQLPGYFTVGGMTSSGIQYYKTEINDQIMVGVETFGGGSEELINDYTMRQKTSNGVDYKLFKGNWFVVSGEDEDGIYYFKEIAKDDRLHSLLLQYPTTQKGLMDSILPRISKSFQ